MTDPSCHPDLKRFWELLAEGCCSGNPLLSTLRLIQDALPPDPMGEAASHLADEIDRGLTLSEAMRKQPAIFGRAHVAMVEGGELLSIVGRVLLLIMESTWRCPTCGNLQLPRVRE